MENRDQLQLRSKNEGDILNQLCTFVAHSGVCDLLKHSKFEEKIDKPHWNLNVLRLKKNDLDGSYDEHMERMDQLPIKKPDRDFKMVLPKQRDPGFLRIAKGK